MRLVSIQVGLPRTVEWEGRSVQTSIFKTPVTGPVRVGRLNLEGDRQSDLTVHGGVEKAVYAYPAEHYAAWRDELGLRDLAFGSFGENLTTEGLLEDAVEIGDRLRAGSAEFVVTQPRMPCFKLAIRLSRLDIVQRFQRSRRSGFYLAVSREGVIASGDAIELAVRAGSGVRVTDVVRLFETDGAEPELLRRASELPALPQAWRDRFRKRLQAPEPDRS